MGWKIIKDFPKLKKYVIIADPHISWHDFSIAIMTRFIKNTKVNYIGKASLFKWPFGFIFKWLGGAPVDRARRTKVVDQIIAIFNEKDSFILGISPEGTRKKVKTWKTGFYFIAKGAQAPIIMATLDFKNKEVRISKPYYLTDSMDVDMDYFYNHFDGVVGKHPELT